MNHFAKKSVAITIATSIALSGCSGLREVQKDIGVTGGKATEAIESMRNNAKTGAGMVHKGSRLAGDEIKVKQREKLPEIFDKKFPYSTKAATPREIIKTISARTGIPAVARTEATSQTAGSFGGMGAMGAAGMMGGMASGMMGGGLGSQQPGSRPMDIEWNDTLRGLLDHLALSLGEYWKFEDGRIHFFEEETRVYNIQLPPGMKSMKASISLGGVSGSGGGSSSGGSSSGGGGSSGGSSGGTVSVDTKQDVDPFSAIVSGISSIMKDTSIPGRSNLGAATPASGASPTGMTMAATGAPGTGGGQNNGKIVPSPELGMISVTAAPPVHERIAAFVDSINKRFARNIMVDLKVYNLTLNKEYSAGVNADINKILLRQFSQIGMGLKSPVIIQPASGMDAGGLTMTVSDKSDPNQVGSFVARAMEGVGDVSLEQNTQVIAVNGQPSPFQVGQEIGYLQSASTSNVQGVGSTATLTPGQKIVGVTGNFVPTVMSDNRILLQYQLSLTALTSKDQVGTSTQFIQTLTTNTQSLQQQAYVNDGQALVLFGYDQNRSSSNGMTGISGLSRVADNKRSISVIVMQVYTGGVN